MAARVTCCTCSALYIQSDSSSPDPTDFQRAADILCGVTSHHKHVSPPPFRQSPSIIELEAPCSRCRRAANSFERRQSALIDVQRQLLVQRQPYGGPWEPGCGIRT